MRTLLIDNYDSFTHNLVQLLLRVTGRAPVVLRNDDTAGLRALELAGFDAVVVSPGPGHPDVARDLGIGRWAVRQRDLPVLGVCLGHQALCRSTGARVDRAPEPVHGRLSRVVHPGTGLFTGIPSPFEAVRYHSLAVYDAPPELEPLAHTTDGVLMAARVRDEPRWGVQFHPESIATQHGARLLANFRDLTGHGPAAPAPPGPAYLPPAPPAGSPYRLHLRELARLPDTETAFAALFADDPAAFWLDSGGPVSELSRYSMLGGAAGPLAELVTYRVNTGEVVVTDGAGAPRARHRETLFDHLNRMLAERAIDDPGLPGGFALGYVGYLGYELKADSATAPARPVVPAQHTGPGRVAAPPDAALVFCDRALLVDHRDRRGWLLSLSGADGPDAALGWLAEAAQRLRRAVPAPPPDLTPGPPPPVVPRHTDAGYAALIDDCQDEIRAGESYEICLTTTLSVPVAVDPLETYRVLRRVNPAPYAAFLALPGLAVLSSSPERFLRVDRAGTAESRPIKGTRPRGADPATDAALAAELRGSEKERAENLMIVDLVRNDLGRVARPGTVTVPRLFGVESYPTVHQLVSTVRAELAADVTPVDCVRASFPGGSMTGAPKLRTLEILDRLEGGPRGVYSGALGYFSLTGPVDLSIVIRTLVVTDAAVTIGVGGAITARSDTAAEIEETRVKARALLHTLAIATNTRVPAPTH